MLDLTLERKDAAFCLLFKVTEMLMRHLKKYNFPSSLGLVVADIFSLVDLSST